MLQNSLQRPRRLSGAEDGEKTYPNRGSKAYEEPGNMEFDSVSRETCTCGEYTSMPRGICLVCIVELHKLSRNKKHVRNRGSNLDEEPTSHGNLKRLPRVCTWM